jgi:LCP family protein required for cell wall assembly
MREIGHGPSKRPISIIKILFFASVLAVLAFILIKVLKLEEVVLKGPQTVIQLITDTGLKSDKRRTNILLLGIGGDGHDGPDLTDTMILASVDSQGKDVALVSIPRDLWAPSISAKINSAYAYGQEKNGEGLSLAKKTVSGLFGIPIHYAFRLDFNGFVKAVDLVGGLDLTVDNSFTDPRYPVTGKEDDLCGLTIETQSIDGVDQQVAKDATGSATPISQINDFNDPFTCRYETLTFQKGPIHMDGATALKFVRSRHGTNNEGSDFARSARQQKVILAFRDKVISSETLTNPATIIDLEKTFSSSIDTDIGSQEIPLFAKLGLKINPATVRKVVLTATEDNSRLEVGPPENYQGQYVLIPKGGSWTDLAEYVQGEVFKTDATNTQSQNLKESK